MLGMFFSGFLFISTHISLDLLSLGNAEAYIGWVGKLNGHLMASCVRNIHTKNYQNLVIGFQVTVKNGRGTNWLCVFEARVIADFGTQCTLHVFTRESSNTALAHLSRHNSVRLSVCLSVCPSVTQVYQSKTVQARITKSSLLAARKTLVSGTVKLFHKFEGGHLEWRC